MHLQLEIIFILRSFLISAQHRRHPSIVQQVSVSSSHSPLYHHSASSSGCCPTTHRRLLCRFQGAEYCSYVSFDCMRTGVALRCRFKRGAGWLQDCRSCIQRLREVVVLLPSFAYHVNHAHVFPKAYLNFFSAAAVAAALLYRVHVVSIASAAACCRSITPSGKIHSFLPRIIFHSVFSGGC
jgi:hypothetical protein